MPWSSFSWHPEDTKDRAVKTMKSTFLLFVLLGVVVSGKNMISLHC